MQFRDTSLLHKWTLDGWEFWIIVRGGDASSQRVEVHSSLSRRGHAVCCLL